MSPLRAGGAGTTQGGPRASGDEPAYGLFYDRVMEWSPRERG